MGLPVKMHIFSLEVRISPFSVLDARIYCVFIFENILLESGNHVRQLHFPVSAPVDAASQLLFCIVVDERLETINLFVTLYIISPFPPAPRVHSSSLILSHLILLFCGFHLFACLCF